MQEGLGSKQQSNINTEIIEIQRIFQHIKSHHWTRINLWIISHSECFSHRLSGHKTFKIEQRIYKKI